MANSTRTRLSRSKATPGGPRRATRRNFEIAGSPQRQDIFPSHLTGKGKPKGTDHACSPNTLSTPARSCVSSNVAQWHLAFSSRGGTLIAQSAKKLMPRTSQKGAVVLETLFAKLRRTLIYLSSTLQEFGLRFHREYSERGRAILWIRRNTQQHREAGSTEAIVSSRF